MNNKFFFYLFLINDFNHGKIIMYLMIKFIINYMNLEPWNIKVFSRYLKFFFIALASYSHLSVQADSNSCLTLQKSS